MKFRKIVLCDISLTVAQGIMSHVAAAEVFALADR